MLTTTLLDLCAIAVWECAAVQARTEGRTTSLWTDLDERQRELVRDEVRQAWAEAAAGDADPMSLVTRVTSTTTAVMREGLDGTVDNDRVRVVWHQLSSESDLARLIADPDAQHGRAFDHSVRVVEELS